MLSGHEHVYERLDVDGIPYFVTGLGGAPIYPLDDAPRPESRARFNGDHGALLASASSTRLSFRFVTRTRAVVDRHVLWAKGP